MQRHSASTPPPQVARSSVSRSARRLASLVAVAAVLVCLLAVQWRAPLRNVSPELATTERQGLGELLSSAIAPSAPSGAGDSAAPVPRPQQRLILDQPLLDALAQETLALVAAEDSWTVASSLGPERLDVALSYSLLGHAAPDSLSPRLNLRFAIEASRAGSLPTPRQIRLGLLPIPEWLARWLGERALARLETRRRQMLLDALAEFETAFEGLTLAPEGAVFSFVWERRALDRLSWNLQRGSISAAALDASQHYLSLLRATLSDLPPSTRAVALSALLPVLAEQALARSSRADPRIENTALLFALSSHLAAATGVISSETPRVADFAEIRLRRRQDLAAHVINSAAIAASAGSDVAGIISTGKEAFDARYLSGFSFSDLTANRAGIRLAELAIGSVDSARELQRRLAAIERDDELLPRVGSNRDGLSQREFEAQYHDRSSPEYRQRLAAIEAQLSQLSLYAQVAL